MTTPCSCSPGACHGGHTIQTGPARFIGPDGRVTAERLHQIVHVEMVCTTEVDRSMAAELLAARARITELEAERPRFSQRQFAQAHRDRDEAQSRAAELAERFAELETERDQHAETARQATNHAIDLATAFSKIRIALAGHPRCEEHPEGDVMKCGWKRAVASVQAAVDAVPAQQELITSETSDGYHTFAELYHYRMLYNAALFNEWAAQGLYDVHKSVRHSDGEVCFDGRWFVVYAQLPGGQISNHYEIGADSVNWYKFQVPIRDTGAEWDGHTPQEAAERLSALLDSPVAQREVGDR